jgi:hypothetical protein
MTTSKTKDDSKVPGENGLAPTTSYANDENLVEEIDDAFLRASKFTKFYRGVLFQMILLGA